MLDFRRSAAAPTHEPELPRPTVRGAAAALLAFLFTVIACADDFSPVEVQDAPGAVVSTPAVVSDLSVKEDTDTSATLTWTEVDDGAHGPALYEVRYGTSPTETWADATPVEDGSCADPVEGREVGASLSCEAGGLAAGETYDFRVTAFRMAADGSRVYGPEPSEAATVELTDSASGPTGGEGSTTGGGSDGDSGGDDGSSGGDGDEVGEGSPDDTDLYPNRPEGFSTLAEASFSSPNEEGWSTRDDDEFSIVTDEEAPRSPSEVGQAEFPAGWTGGWSPISRSASITHAGARRLYVSFWVKVSENWQGHHVGDKLGYLWTNDDPVVFPIMRGGGDNSLHTQLRIQDVPDGARSLDPNLDSVEIVRGRWHRWEILVVSNTGDAADGEIHWWVDGRKAGDYRDVRFGTSSDGKVWNYATWRPVWGGSGGTVRETMHMRMDHYYVAGAP